MKWAYLEEKFARILNIFTGNLHTQYILSTEPTGAIPIMLTSQADLAELHKRLAPLVVPPQNADGSVSKRKMKEVIVKVTDKGDDANSSASNGKVCYRLFSYQVLKNLSRRRMKAKNNLIRLSHMMRSTKRGLLFMRQSGPIGSVTCTLLEIGLFRAGRMDTQHSAMLLQRMTSIYGLNYMYVVQIFYHIVYSECHDNQIKNPTTVSIDTKPPQINLYHSIHHRGSQDKH
jgi:hypothetical protein